jgi:hypothetical protein
MFFLVPLSDNDMKDTELTVLEHTYGDCLTFGGSRQAMRLMKYYNDYTQKEIHERSDVS